MINIKNITTNLSTKDISFLIDIDRNIEINKRNKAFYFKIFGLNLDQIQNFIYNIRDNDVLLIYPFISVSCKLSDPYLSLSRQFLITNKSNPTVIASYLYDQLEKCGNDFGFDLDDLDFYLIFKYKKVYLNDKTF